MIVTSKIRWAKSAYHKSRFLMCSLQCAPPRARRTHTHKGDTRWASRLTRTDAMTLIDVRILSQRELTLARTNIDSICARAVLAFWNYAGKMWAGCKTIKCTGAQTFTRARHSLEDDGSDDDDDVDWACQSVAIGHNQSRVASSLHVARAGCPSKTPSTTSSPPPLHLSNLCFNFMDT